MDLELTDDQQGLRDLARTLFTEQCRPDVVRRARAAEEPVDTGLWRRLADADLLRLGTAERCGGVGAGDVELAVLMDEAGRVACPGPLLETTVAARTLTSLPACDLTDSWQHRLGGGAAATLALAGQQVVVDAGEGSIALYTDGDGIHLLAPDRYRLETARSASGARRVGRLVTEPGRDTILDTRSVDVLRARTAVMCSAMLLGLAARMIEMTVEHVRDRHQFGRPVGSFQAVKHHLANAHRNVETSRPAVWSAAQLLTEGTPDAVPAASVAAVAAIGAAAEAGDCALQCHGGVGFTLEHDLHLWLTHAKVLERAYGTAADHRARLATALFDRPTDRPTDRPNRSSGQGHDER